MTVLLSLLFFGAVICVIQIIRPNASYFYDVTQRADTLSYQGISLTPGVYQIEMDYRTDTSTSILCTAKDGTVFTGGLQVNGENLHVGKDRADFLMWLFEGTNSLEIYLTNLEDNYAEVGNLAIYETNLLWTMLLTTLLFLMALLIGLSYFRYYDHRYGIDQKRKSVIFVLIVITFIASLPYLLGTNIAGGDLTYHLNRIDALAQGLRDGQFPVRIYSEWPHGYGYADGVMYGNTLILFPALLRILGFTLTTSYNLFAIAINIATVWISYFCFSRIWKSRSIGLVCSALYTLSIFRIYRLVITSAVGEGSAFTFLPLILYGFYFVLTRDPQSRTYRYLWIPLALGYGIVIQTHVLTSEITIFITLFTCICFWKRVFRKESFLILAKGALGALGISLWFLVPFLDYFINENLHVTNVSARTIQDRGLYIAQLAFHWWKVGSNASWPELGMQYSHALGVGMVLMMGFATLFILWFSGKWKMESTSHITLGKFSLIVSGALMLMCLSVFPWDVIQKLGGPIASLVSSLQFTNRFLGWTTVFLIIIYGSCLWFFQAKKQQFYYYIGIVLTFVAVTTSGLYLLDHVATWDHQYVIYNEEGIGMAYLAGAEYLVEGTKEELLEYRDPISSEGVVTQGYQRQGLTSRFFCENTGEQEGYVDLPVLLYKGYQAWDLGSRTELTVVIGFNNCARILIPSDFHGEIILRFSPPIYWRLAEVGSYLGWIVLLSCSVIYLRKHRKEVAQNAILFEQV
jgi:hypothetical protein